LRLVWDLPCFRPFKWTAHGVKPSTGEGRFEDILGPTFERLTPRNGEEERAFVLRKTLGGFRPTKALRPGFSCVLQQFVSCFESVAIQHTVLAGQGDAVLGWRCRVAGIKIEQTRGPSCDAPCPERMTP
jgi:hypothetical protein